MHCLSRSPPTNVAQAGFNKGKSLIMVVILALKKQNV